MILALMVYPQGATSSPVPFALAWGRGRPLCFVPWRARPLRPVCCTDDWPVDRGCYAWVVRT